MMKKTHVSVGVTLSTIIAAAVGVKLNILFLMAAAAGTIFPDIDHPNGSLNRKILLVRSNGAKVITYTMMAIIVAYYGPKYFDWHIVVYIIPIIIAVAISHHRGITHSITLLGVIATILYLIKVRYGINLIIPFTLGVATHIFLDMFNPQGCELFYPYKKNYRFPVTIATGGLLETILFIVFFMIFIYIFYKSIGIRILG